MDILKKQNDLEMYIGKGNLPGIDNPRGQHLAPWTRPDNLVSNELLYEQEDPDFVPTRGKSSEPHPTYHSIPLLLPCITVPSWCCDFQNLIFVLGMIGDTIIINDPDDVDDYYVMVLSYIGYIHLALVSARAPSKKSPSR